LIDGHGNHGRHSRNIGDQEEGGFSLSLSLSLSLSMCSFSWSTNQRTSLLAPLIREYDCHSEQQTDCCKEDETVERWRQNRREREKKKTNKQSNGRKLCPPFNKVKEMATQTNKQAGRERNVRDALEREREKQTKKTKVAC